MSFFSRIDISFIITEKKRFICHLLAVSDNDFHLTLVLFAIPSSVRVAIHLQLTKSGNKYYAILCLPFTSDLHTTRSPI